MGTLGEEDASLTEASEKLQPRTKRTLLNTLLRVS
jgi:hypothetical protein